MLRPSRRLRLGTILERRRLAGADEGQRVFDRRLGQDSVAEIENVSEAAWSAGRRRAPRARSLPAEPAGRSDRRCLAMAMRSPNSLRSAARSMRQSTLSTLAPVAHERLEQVMRRLGEKNHGRIAGGQLGDQELRGRQLEIAIGRRHPVRLPRCRKVARPRRRRRSALCR